MVFEGKQIREWIRDLEYGEPSQQIQACEVLGQAGELARPALPAITVLLFQDSRHVDPVVKRRAQQAVIDLGEIGVHSLIGLLGHPEPRARYEAVTTLAMMGPAASSAVEVLIWVLERQDEQPRVRQLAAFALGRAGPAAKMAIDPLHQYVRSRSFLTQASLTAIGQIGTESTHVIDDVINCLSMDDPLVVVCAAETVGQLGKPASAALPVIGNLLEHSDMLDAGVAYALVESLGKFGPLAQKQVAELKVLIESGTLPAIRRHAIETLGKIQVPTADILEQLRSALDDSDPRMRASAIKGLSQMHTLATPLLEQLRQRLANENDVTVRHLASTLITKIERTSMDK